jgi:hypothetical protein
MKKLLFVVSALAALSLLAPSTGFAQSPHVYPNQVGLYAFSDGTGATGTDIIGAAVLVYLVLTKPEADGVTVTNINAFECTLNFNPAGNLFKLAEVFPGNNVNVGDNSDISQGFLEYIVGFATEHPVTDESITLVTFTFMHTAGGVIEVSLSPTSKPGVPGEMIYQNAAVPGDLRIMHTAAGPDGGPVYIFDGSAVATENESFGSVKALYR